MKVKFKSYQKRFLNLVKQPFFWVLTVAGNLIVLVGGCLLQYFEGNSPTASQEYIDYLLWSMGTVTTVGYSNFTPVTIAGKWTIFFLMASGTLFIWTYMAFLVTGLIAPELANLERDVHTFEKELKEVRPEVRGK